MRARSLVASSLVVLASAACGEAKPEVTTFELAGAVRNASEDARPKDDPTGSSAKGLLLVLDLDSAGLEACRSFVSGTPVFIAKDADFTPREAAKQLDKLVDAAVAVKGRVVRRGDECLLIARSVEVLRGAQSPPPAEPVTETE